MSVHYEGELSYDEASVLSRVAHGQPVSRWSSGLRALRRKGLVSGSSKRLELTEDGFAQWCWQREYDPYFA